MSLKSYNPFDRNLDHSRLFDVTVMPASSALRELSRNIFERHFGSFREKKAPLTLEVVLANLYAAWLDDPTLTIAVPMGQNAYKARSRYNPLHISYLITDVVRRLVDDDLVDCVLGFSNRTGEHGPKGTGRLTRIWASGRLVASFEELTAESLHVVRHVDTEPVILRNSQGKEIDYEDTDNTIAMRQVLCDYNMLLSRTFIDIPELENPIIPTTGKPGLVLSRSGLDHHVHRIFNHGSWDKGGRFYGGWWQSCPKEWRAKICIDDQPTIEDDFSGLHIVMLYGWQGIDYWTTVPDCEDPYGIETPAFIEDPEQCRRYSKSLFLMAVNADTDKKAFGAFRAKMRAEGDALGAGLKDVQLAFMLDALREKHKPIADYLGSGAGIDLMNQDSKVTEWIIRTCTAQRIPVLSVHDSYIVRATDDFVVELFVRAALNSITGIQHARLKRVGVGKSDSDQILKRLGIGPYKPSSTQAWSQARMAERTVTPGYLRRRDEFSAQIKKDGDD